MALLLSSASRANAASDVSVDLFYNALGEQGQWLETTDYGYVWQPSDVAEDWRPYTDGNWIYTDAGWTWDSEEPYGWAVYHYGRWVEMEETGWAWVPDTEWGPAWVSWRRSPKHIGWAPLPPEARFERTVGIKTWSDSYYDVGPTHYSFVDVKNFGAPKLRAVVLPQRENITVIRETTNITNITYNNTVVFNGGPEYDVVVRESAQPIRRLRLDRRTDIQYDGGVVVQDRFRNRVEGDSFQVIAPQINITNNNNVIIAPKNVTKHVQKVVVNRGWRDAGDQAQVQQMRTKMKADARPPAELPKQPKFETMAVRAERRGAKNPAAGAAATAPGDAETPAIGAPANPGEPATVERGARKAKNAAAKRAGAPADPAASVDGAPAPVDATTAPDPAATATAADGATEPGRKPRGMGKDKNRKPDGAEPVAGTPDATAPDADTSAPGEKLKGQKARDRARKNSGETGSPGAAPVAPTATPDAPAAPLDAADPTSGRPEKARGKRREGPGKPADSAVPEPADAAGAAPQAAAPEVGNRPGRPAKPNRPEADRPEPGERQEKAVPSAGAARPDAPAQPDAPNRPARPDRPEAAPRGDRPDGAGKPRGGGPPNGAVAPGEAPARGNKAAGGNRPGGGKGEKKARGEAEPVVPGAPE